MKTADTPEVLGAMPRTAQPAPSPPAEESTAPAAEAAPQKAASTTSRWNPPARSSFGTIAIVALLAVAISAILYAWRLPPFAGRYEQTDDAYVRGQTTVISPQVSGYVSEVPVNDFADVKAGDVLVRIEDSIYSARVAQARANVQTQQANLDNSVQAQRSREVDTLARDAAIANAEAQLAKVQTDLRRTNALIAHGWTTAAVRDQQVAALRAAEAQLRQARAARQIGAEEVRSVIVGRNGLNANVEAAKAQLRLAQIELGHAVIRAPKAGQLGEVAVRQGQYVTAGTQLMHLVPKTLWVTANFKEAQTRKMQMGQAASFTVDALGDARLTGRVESLAPAAGSEFAVLRPDNATGNFVKVAQRMAVRIRIDRNQPLAERLRPGMSVVARIRTDDQ